MSKLDNYKGSVEMQSGMKPMGVYPLMEAHDVMIKNDGTRLDEAFEHTILTGASTVLDAKNALDAFDKCGAKVFWETAVDADGYEIETCEMIGFNRAQCTLHFLCKSIKQIVTIDYGMAGTNDTLTLAEYTTYEDIGSSDFDPSIYDSISALESNVSGLKGSVNALGVKDAELADDIAALETEMNTRFAELPEPEDGKTPYIGQDDNYWYIDGVNTYVKALGEKGDKGDKGDTGKGFSIAKTYASVAEMNADHSNTAISLGDFVLVSTGNVEDEDNAKLYVKTSSGYNFLTDLSGEQGIKGEDGVGIESIALKSTSTDSEGRKVNVYEITYTSGSKTAFTVTNGKDGNSGVTEIVLSSTGGTLSSAQLTALNASPEDFVLAYTPSGSGQKSIMKHTATTGSSHLYTMTYVTAADKVNAMLCVVNIGSGSYTITVKNEVELGGSSYDDTEILKMINANANMLVNHETRIVTLEQGGAGGGSYVLELTEMEGTLSDEQYAALEANAPNVVVLWNGGVMPLISALEGMFVFQTTGVGDGDDENTKALNVGMLVVNSDKSYGLAIEANEFTTKTYVDNAVANALGTAISDIDTLVGGGE